MKHVQKSLKKKLRRIYNHTAITNKKILIQTMYENILALSVPPDIDLSLVKWLRCA